MADPTIVLASLSDDKLKESINSLVKHVNDKMEEMVESTNSAVKRMEDKLKSLGSLKIDTGGSNDGGTGRRTQQHEKLTKAVNDASEAVSKETQKLQDLQQSLSGASDREQNFISQKERAANTITQENELLSKQQSELAALKAQEQQLADAHQKDMQSRQQNAAAIEKQRGAVKYYEEELSSLQARLTSAQAKIDRFYEVQAKARESISSRLHAPSDQFIGYNDYERGKSVYSKTEQDVRSLIKALSELDNADKKHGFGDELRRAYMNLTPSQDMANVFKRQQEEISSYIKTLQEAKKGTKGETRANLDNQILAGKELLAIYKELGNAQNALNKTVQKEGLRDGGNVGGIKRDIEETQKAYGIAKQKLEQLTQSTQQSNQIRQESLNLDAKIQEKLKEISETRGRIATATREQTEAERNASQAAREKANIQGQVANQEKQVAEAKKQLTTATQQQAEVEKQSVQNIAQQTAARDKQIKKNQEVSMSFDQMAAATQKATSGSKMSVIETYDMQIEMFKNRLREVRQDIDIFNAAIGSGKKTQIEWGQQGLKQANAEAEKLMRIITTLENQRGNLSNVLAPQGHTIQNYVNSLQKANPELAQLNEQFKRGKALLQQQKTEFEQNAQAQRGSANQQKQTLDEMNAYIRQNIQREQERREAIRQTGLAAQDAFAKIRQNAQIQLAENTDKPIKGIKELADAITNMRRLYFDMSTAEKESPLGLALKRDIENAQKLKFAIDAYNRTLSGMTVIGTKNNTNSSLGAYTELTNILKTLSDEYKRLGREERNAAKGNDLADKIQRLSRATQKIQQQMNRPISFAAAMKGDEKTLDDIAYKMQRLRAYKQGIDLTKPNAANEIKHVDEALAKLQKDADKWMSKSNEMIKSNTALGRSWNYMKNRLAFYFTVGASTQFIKNLIEVRSQYEMNERALGILIDSAERGTRIFNELSQMALVSPYTLIELSTAAKQLTAYDVAAKDVVDTTRRLADMAAAVGIPIERLTYALGQIKAYGYLNARDARMFSNAGIPLVKQLAEHYTELEGKMVSTADVYDRIKKKAIDMTDVMQVINKMTDEGGKFFDFQAKMAGTLKVQLANLTLAWNNMLNDIGASEQGTISTGIGLLKELFLQWKNISKMVTNLAIGFGVVKAAQLAYYGVVMGTNKAIALETVLGNRLSNSLRSLASSTNAAKMPSTALWVGIATFAAAAVVDILRGNEAMKEFNKTLRENAENTYNDLKKFSENYSGLRESLYKTENGKQTPVDINSEEAKKAWEVLREQIELSSHASDEYIGKLLSIENVSERLRQGFAVIDSIQAVSAAIKEIGDSAIKLERDWSAWWNLGLLPDGTIGNLQDAYMWLSKIEEKYGSVVNARKVASTSRTDEGFKNVFQDEAKEFVENYETELEKFRKDIQVTKQSIIDFIELKGWSGDTSKINEVFKTFTDNLILKNQLNPQQAYTLQLEMEEARSKAAKEALLQRINDERAALKISHDDSVREALAADIERYKNWDETNGRSKVEWERFTKWLKEQHISETTAMFRNMDAEDIRSLNFQEGKHAEWVKRMVTQYAKEHKMSYDDAFGYLKSWVTSANQWSIFIPMTISTEDPKTVYKQLGEYDKAIDDADAQIERLTKRINELNAKKKKSKEETKELADAEKELTQAQKDKADAEAKGGHGKKEKKDERAANKAAKQAESELAKALKDELSTIEKVRSIYKDLTKEGMSHVNAVERATRGWDETVNAINRVLQKNGLQKLDLSKFAGIENPRELVNMLQSQLNTLLKRGAKPAEIKELQTKVNTLKVDADKYDLTKITKGLNNELGKLKDEYELAVELDADPELGDMFTEMFGIDTSAFPRTINEFMQMAQQEFEDARKKFNLSESINIFTANSEQWYKWGEAVGYSKEQVDDFKKSFDGSVAVAKKWAQDVVKQTQDLQYKLADNNGKIAIEEEKLANLRVRLANEVNDEQGRLLKLQIQDQQNAIAKLKEELLQLLPTYQRVFGEVAEHSSWMTRKLAKDYKNMLVEGKNRGLNSDNTYSVRDPITGQVARITKERMGKEIKNADKELQNTQSTVKKITEAFTKGEDDVVDWVHGVELVGEELGKMGQLVDVVGNIADAFSNPDEYNETAEAIHDIAASLQGVSTASKGIGQIASGDYIGGAVSVASGLFSAISTWFDNDDKKILQQIKDSERAVKRLENAYKELGYAAGNAFGAATSGAQEAIKANKELQLVELKRQLALEQSRDSKNKDEDKIIEIRGQIIDLEHEIEDFTKNAVNDLLGISSHGDFFESMISEMIEAFKNGEDAMEVFEEKWSDMIDNMIMKTIVSQVLSQWVKTLERGADDILEKYTEESSKKMADLANEMTNLRTMDAGDASEWIYNNDRETFNKILESLGVGNVGDMDWLERRSWFYMAQGSGLAQKVMDAYLAMLDNNMAGLQDELDKQSLDATGELIDYYGEAGKEFKENYLNQILDKIQENWNFGQDSEKQLSQLQQGIQGVTEDTAGALEAITNGISQQSYLQSDLLTQIRDAVVGMDMDIQVATQAQMLLQLQQSYAVQMAIQGILEGWNNPSGQAVRVELVS